MNGPTTPIVAPSPLADPARLAYYVALITAIDQSGISPGFARVSHECADGFEITLTISQSLVDDYAAHLEEDACPDCGGFGEYFGHADDCDSDSCALNGDIDSCNGQVFVCHCSPHLLATSSAPSQVPGPISNERGDE